MSLRYPVAASGEAAVRDPLGWGERARDATHVAGVEVDFATELYGPAFETSAAARAHGEAMLAQGWCALRPVVAEGARPPPPQTPSNLDGVRWPAPSAGPPTLWRLSISYWRVRSATAHPDPSEAPTLPPARRARRDRDAARAFDGRALNALAEQPMRAFRAQQPLDVGLFETRLPESPDVIVADE